MAPFYEKRDKDFFYRDDHGGKTKLACSPHLHRHIEFAFMTDGCADGYADSSVYRVEKGDFFIAFPNHIFIKTAVASFVACRPFLVNHNNESITVTVCAD